jgi:hypothetical protein
VGCRFTVAPIFEHPSQRKLPQGTIDAQAGLLAGTAMGALAGPPTLRV